MFKTVLISELKNIVRDKMYLFFAIYPVILGFIGYLLIPYMENRMDPLSLWPEIVAMFMILITGFIFGALTAFTLLDDKDDLVLMSLKITPISVKYYVVVKLITSYIFAVFATIILIYATGFLPGAGVGTVILIALAGAIQAPGVALIVNSFADNKVEGFVVMKLSGMILVLPVVAFFVMDWQEVFLAFAPGFWTARMIQIELLPMMDYNLTFIAYFLVGIVYNLGFLYLLMKIYSKRSNI